MKTPRFIYQHGIVRTSDSHPTLRLIATTELPIYTGRTFTLVDGRKESLQDRIAHLGSPQGPSACKDFEQISDVRYALDGSSYHLSNITTHYAEIVSLFRNLESPIIEGNTCDTPVCFEFDAFLSSSTRVFEAARRLLWKHYGNSSGQWRSFQSMLEGQLLPSAVYSTIKSSYLERLISLKSLRDCLMHYVPVGPESSVVRTYNIQGEWGVRTLLPSNPYEKSRNKFKFDGPELLEFCWETLIMLVEMSEYLMSLELIKELIDNPETGEHWNKLAHQAVTIER